MQIFSKKKKQKTSPSKDPQVKIMERRRHLEFQGKTDKGRIRKNNEDFFGFKMPEGKEKLHKYGSLFIVADGVGGSANGEVASQMAVSIISNLYYAQPEDLTPEARLQIAFDKANQTIRSKAQEMHTPEMATTATVAVVFPDRAIIANIGDSRCYVINPERTKNITQVTQDHSLVAEQVREGLITSQQAKVSKNKNVITRALGIEPRIKVDFFKLPIAPGDKILLTTDGLLRVLNDEQIYQVVQQPGSLNPVDALISLANKGGAPDNVTVCIIDLDKKVSFVKRNPLAIGITAFAVLAILAGYFFAFYKLVDPMLTNIKDDESVRLTLRLHPDCDVNNFKINDALGVSIQDRFDIKPPPGASTSSNSPFQELIVRHNKDSGNPDFISGNEYVLIFQDKNKFKEVLQIRLKHKNPKHWELLDIKQGETSLDKTTWSSSILKPDEKTFLEQAATIVTFISPIAGFGKTLATSKSWQTRQTKFA
jgi:protein phosphatase